MFARTVDVSDQCRQRHLLGLRDFLQVSPKRIFEADASLVSSNENRTFNDPGFFEGATVASFSQFTKARAATTRGESVGVRRDGRRKLDRVWSADLLHLGKSGLGHWYRRWRSYRSRARALSFHGSGGGQVRRRCVLRVAEREGHRAQRITFAHRILSGWCDAKTRCRMGIKPTHWRQWAR